MGYAELKWVTLRKDFYNNYESGFKRLEELNIGQPLLHVKY